MKSAFISYSWDSKPHPTWVQSLSKKLRKNGIETILDQWHAVPGDSLPEFMETAIRENDHVIIICTPSYKKKSDSRKGGVGYEGDIMTGEAFVLKNRRKFIPVLREGEWHEAAPSWLLGSYYIDLTGIDWEDNYSLLVDTINRRLPEPPPIAAQGFRVLPDKSVLDTKTDLIWANCRSIELVVLEDIGERIKLHEQATGWTWRLPTRKEVEIVKEAEEYYPRPPIMVIHSMQHTFFDNFDKGPWTNKTRFNVRKGDQGNSGSAFHAAGLAGAFSGIANSLNLDPHHMASEAESLRRQFLLRMVRVATDEDYLSSQAE